MDPNQYPQPAYQPQGYETPAQQAPAPVQQGVVDGMVAIAFTRYYEQSSCAACCESCCPCCSSCCDQDKLGAMTVVVPENTTVKQFIKIAKKALGDEDQDNSIVYLDCQKLRPDDLIAPTVLAYKYFRFPVLQISGPPQNACNLI